MKASEWPNKIGWDVPTTWGMAEVRDLVTKLRVFVPLADYHACVCDVPLGTPPARAVVLCLQKGARYGYEQQFPAVVPEVTP
jgi:hypothetical protein